MSQRAMVVFLGADLVDNPAWYAPWLKPGFIHCFILVQSSGQWWIKIEGQYGRVCVSCVQLRDVAVHYRNQGALVVETTVVRARGSFPLVARTCVGLIKAVLGIRSMAITPWQLYKHIVRS